MKPKKHIDTLYHHTANTPYHHPLLIKVFDEAKEAYREAMQIYLAHYGRENADVAKVTNNFATLLDAMGEREEALFFYDQARLLL